MINEKTSGLKTGTSALLELRASDAPCSKDATVQRSTRPVRI